MKKDKKRKENPLRKYQWEIVFLLKGIKNKQCCKEVAASQKGELKIFFILRRMSAMVVYFFSLTSNKVVKVYLVFST